MFIRRRQQLAMALFAIVLGLCSALSFLYTALIGSVVLR